MTRNRCAFYAPMKPPSSDRPSGDRKMARLLMKSLSLAGFDPILASTFQTRDGDGNPDRQRNLKQQASSEIGNAKQSLTTIDPAFWMTYHLYYKAPDWIGPAIADAFSIPYIVVEASLAEKRADGPWALNHLGAKAAIAQADLILQPNPEDIEATLPHLKPGARLVAFPVPIEINPAPDDGTALRKAFAKEYGLDVNATWISCAAMMRAGAKQTSYKVIADTVSSLEQGNWNMVIAGDGPASEEIRAGFGQHPAVRFLGELPENRVFELFLASDIYFWPGVQEAFGYATLEAQAAGLPALVGDRPGTRALVDPGASALLCDPVDSAGFAANLSALIGNQSRLGQMHDAALTNVKNTHDINIVSDFLKNEIESVVSRTCL